MEIDVLRIDSERKENFKDNVSDESFLTIHLNDKEFLTLLCSPDKLIELSVGFLYSAGLVHSLKDIENISVNKRNMTSRITLKEKEITADVLFQRAYTSGCGKGMLFHNVLDVTHKKIITGNIKIHSNKIIELMKDFGRKSTEFKKTGCVHSAALSNKKTILVFHEDIGRHNAIDKVIGEALYKNLNMEELIVLTTGRISSEIMYKVQKMRSAMLISRSAPTDLAVRLAERWNVTLVGFVRGQRMNVYTAKERIL